MSMNSVTGESAPPPMNPFDATILEHLAEHRVGEAEILAESPDPPVRYLAQLILADEERHHRVLAELANPVPVCRLARRARAARPVAHEEHGSPRTRSHGAPSTTVRVARLEWRDLRQLRKLVRQLRPTRNHSLDPVIVATLSKWIRANIFGTCVSSGASPAPDSWTATLDEWPYRRVDVRSAVRFDRRLRLQRRSRQDR